MKKMKKSFNKTLLLLFSILTILTMPNIFCALGDTWHFNTQILTNPQDVKQRLIQEDGFEEVDIDPAIELNVPTPDGQATTKRIFSKQMLTNFLNQMSNGQHIQNIPELNQNKKIKGLFLERPNARATIIFTPGFWPGYKESFASFVKLVPQDCNLLFIELQGHGESSSPSCGSNLSSCLKLPNCCSLLPGCSTFPCCFMPSCLSNSCLTNNMLCKTFKFFLGLKKYGLHEYKDIIGAFYYIAERTQGKAIIPFGWCAGAHNSAQALIKLREMSPEGQDLIRQLNIQGLIFDSGFGSIKDAAKGLYKFKNKGLGKCLEPIVEKPLISTILNKTSKALSWVTKLISKIPGLKKLNTSEHMIKAFLCCTPKLITDGLLKMVECLFKKSMNQNEAETKLFDKMHNIASIKTLFVHSRQDSLAPLAKTQELANQITDHEFLITEGDYHAKNQLKYKELYKQKLEQWLDDTIVEQQPANPNDQNNNQNPIIQQIITIINTLINLIDNQTNNSGQEFANLFQQMSTLIANNQNIFSREFIGLYQNLSQELIKSVQNPKEGDDQNIKNILLQMKALLTQNNQQPANPRNQDNNQNNQQPANPQNSQIQPSPRLRRTLTRKNILQMIRIIDQIITLVKKSNPGANTQQEFETLLEQFKALLENPITNIPQKTKQEIAQKFMEMHQAKEKKDVIIIKLEEIKEILRKILYPGKTINPAKGKPNKKDNLINNPNYFPNNSYPSKDTKEKRPIYTSPKKNKSDSGRSGGNSSSGSSDSPSSSYSGYNDYPNEYPESGYNNGYPSYSGGNDGGYNDMDWVNDLSSMGDSPQKNNIQKSPGITINDIIAMDEKYGPEMDDQPDRVHVYPSRRRKRFNGFNNWLK
ncbi:hypothetical protein ACFLYU_01255 [Candidatus Dependentiae bacterium]